MYGLPREFDGRFLLERTLQMVCFNENQVYLHFDGDVTIAIESAFSCKTSEIVNLPVHESNLMQLLGRSVSRVHGDEHGTLDLEFDDGIHLRVYDTSQQYESYTITHGDKVIIV